MTTTSKITTNLWFANEAEEAANYYVSIFKNAKINRLRRYGKEGFEIHKMPEGTVMTVEFELNGHHFVALNAGPVFKFNEAISLIVNVDNQEELDYYWGKLSAGGDKNSQVCGWLKDKYGLSWQVVPKWLSDLPDDTDQKAFDAVMKELLKMKKLDIGKLKEAYESVKEPA
jgi:predicted 3-demethylubiquinone-9 3-methyltransferase (glyoxalase superfamily)